MANITLDFNTVKQSSCVVYNRLKRFPLNVIWWCAFLVIVGLGLLTMCLPGSGLGPVEVTEANNNSVIHGMMPFQVNSHAPGGSHQFSFTFEKHHLHPDTYHITPDDCLTSLIINNNPVDISILSPMQLCNSQNGFIIDLSKYLHDGPNNIVAYVNDKGEQYGLSFSPHYPLIGHVWLTKTLFVTFVLIIFLRFVFDENSHSTSITVWLYLVISAIIIRLPFFFQSASNEIHFIFTAWDESTFINMGQNVLDGYLPYVKLWDNKPPLLFYTFAALIKLSNHSLIGVRLIGAIVVGSTGFLCLSLVEKLSSRIAGWYAALLYVIYSSVDSWTYSVFSDHFCAPLVVTSYLLFLNQHLKHWHKAALIGLLIGLAAMIQTNYWFLTFFFALMQLIWFDPFTERKFLGGILCGAILGAFSAIPFLSFWLVYAHHGYSELFWRSVVTAESGFVKINFDHDLISAILSKFGVAENVWYYRVGSHVFLPYILCFLALLLWFTPHIKLTRYTKFTFFIFFMGTILAAGMRGNTINRPTQALGFILSTCLISGILLSHIITRRNVMAAIILLYCVYVSFQASFPIYSDMLTKLAEKEPFEDDANYRIAATINNSPIAHPYIYSCETDQILYYLTRSYIPSYIAHAHIMTWGLLPNTAYGYPIPVSAMFEEIKSHHPAYIIGPENHFCFNSFGSDYMKNYNLLFQIENEQVWQVKS